MRTVAMLNVKLRNQKILIRIADPDTENGCGWTAAVADEFGKVCWNCREIRARICMDSSFEA